MKHPPGLLSLEKSAFRRIKLRKFPMNDVILNKISVIEIGERMFRYFYRIWDKFRYKYKDKSEIVGASMVSSSC